MPAIVAATPIVPESNWTVGYRLGAAAVDVAGNDPGDLAYLTEFLEPWCDDVPAGSAPLRVRMLRSTPMALDLERTWAAGVGRESPVPCVRLDTRTIAFEGWREPGVLRLVDPVTGCFFLLGDGTVDVVSRSGSEDARLGLLGLVREIITGAVSAGQPIVDLHASAFALGGRAVLIAGAKGAGKTSLLCHALVAARADLVSNDRVFVDVGACPPLASGVPTVVSIRPDTLRAFPQLGERAAEFPALAPSDVPSQRSGGIVGLASSSADRLLLSPARFAGRLGAARVRGAAMAAILLPEIRTEVPGQTLERLPTELALTRLQSCLYGLAADRDEPTLFGRLAMADATGRPAGAGLEHLASTVPVYTCRMGRDAYDGPATILLEALGLGNSGGD